MRFIILMASLGWGSAGLSGEELSEFMHLVVSKKDMRAELRTLPRLVGSAAILGSFQVAMGRKQGDKNVEGDLKTPEGIYFTLPHIGNLPFKKYGPLAIPLDFPNPIDRLKGKTGYGIWLHGAGDDARISKKFVTEGCVAFFNSDIERIQSWLPGYQGVVTIAESFAEVNQVGPVAQVSDLTNQWIDAWQERDHSKYVSFYHEDLKFKGRGLEYFTTYKKNVFDAYRQMTVVMTDVRIVTHPKYAVSVMSQSFNGDDRYISKGKKTLFWAKSGDSWKILAEDFSTRRLMPLSYQSRDIQVLQAQK